MNQMIDEAYENYTNYPLATISDKNTNILYQNIDKGWCVRNGRSVVSPHPTRHLTKEEFINKCKTDPEFSEKWGLKIEERELSLDERCDLGYKYVDPFEWDMLMGGGKDGYEGNCNDYYIPTKLITITYNNKTIEVYE